MPKEGSNAFYRAYADRVYFDRANRDTYLARQAVGDLLTSGHIHLPTKLVKGLDAPGADGDAARKKYVDDLVALYLPLAGGTLTGNLALDALKTVDGVDLSVHAATLAAHMGDQTQKLRTGQYIVTAWYPSGSATFTLVANTLYAIPLVVVRDVTVDRIAVLVATAASGKSIRLGIYNDGTNLYPGTLLLDAGTVSAATTGLKAITISQALTKGLYWLVLVSDGTPAMRQLNAIAPAFLGTDVTDFGTWNVGWTVAFTYAALPDPFTAGAAFSTTQLAAIVLRLLSLD